MSEEVTWMEPQISGTPMIVSIQQNLTGDQRPPAGNDDDNIMAVAVNNWDALNVNTVTSWRNNVAKTSFVYGVILQKHETNLERSLLITLAIGTLMTLLAAVSVALGPLNNKWVVLGFDVVILVGSALITVSNGLIKIYGWDESVKHLTKIIEKLDALWYTFETELNLQPDQRQDAKDFIKRTDSDYAHLMQQCPHINMEEYIQASQEYQTRLSKNLIWQYQFNRQMRTELREIRVHSSNSQ